MGGGLGLQFGGLEAAYDFEEPTPSGRCNRVKGDPIAQNIIGIIFKNILTIIPTSFVCLFNFF